MTHFPTAGQILQRSKTFSGCFFVLFFTASFSLEMRGRRILVPRRTPSPSLSLFCENGVDRPTPACTTDRYIMEGSLSPLLALLHLFVRMGKIYACIRRRHQKSYTYRYNILDKFSSSRQSCLRKRPSHWLATRREFHLLG